MRTGRTEGTGRTGAALYRLLLRPAAFAWVPLAALASLTLVGLMAVFLRLVVDSSVLSGIGALSWTLAALIGLLVGQAIKELQHCHFSWGLPGLRSRLLAGTLVVGGGVALLLNREVIVTVLWAAQPLIRAISGSRPDLLRAWAILPPLSLGLVAVLFLAFWIGVRPSPINLIGVMAPLVVFGPLLVDAVVSHGIFVASLSAPLTAFLIYDTFSARSARRRPFIPTQPLAGGAWSRSRKPLGGLKPTPLTRGSGADWRVGRLGPSVHGWIRAGWHENHGQWGRIVQIAAVVVPISALVVLAGMLLPTFIATASLWLGTGVGTISPGYGGIAAAMKSIIIGSTLIAIPLAVFLAAYASISLQRVGLYPLARKQLASVEYWGSLVETLIITGMLAAILLGFWTFLDQGLNAGRLARWPLRAGGEHGWVLVLMRPLAIAFIFIPLAQYFRLRFLRAPRAWSPVAQLVGVFALAALLTWAGTRIALASLVIRLSLLVPGAIFTTAVLLSQYIYRRGVDRYFRNADLV
jgi:hypothetical protein